MDSLQINFQEIKNDLKEIKNFLFEKIKQQNPEGYATLMRELNEEKFR
jgi:hypothetical protein